MSGFSFGIANTQATGIATNTLAFGTPKTTNVTAPAFGFPAATTAAGFGTSTGVATNFAFPSTSGSTAPTFGVTPQFNFSTPVASTAPPSLPVGNFSFGLTTPATTTSATPQFNFGTPLAATSGSANPAAAAASGATAATAQPFGLGGTTFSFAKANSSTAPGSLSFGLTTNSMQPTLNAALFSKSATTTGTTATPAFVGLGGIDATCTQPKSGDLKQDYIKIKETQVPDEIARTVESFKNYVKLQKTLSSEIGRTSTSKLTNLSGEIVSLKWALQEISNTVEANNNQIKLLRKETSKTIQSLEMAQRTQDTPVGLQFENNAPLQYFQNLVAKYEEDLVNFREQIILTERHMQSLTNPQSVSPEDIKRGLRQINESFISLAGRLHELHQQVEAQKEQYLNLRKYRLRDSTDVFAKLDTPEPKAHHTHHITAGPTPFSNLTALSNFGKSFYNTAPNGTTATAPTQTAK